MEFSAIQIDSAPGVLVEQILGRITSGELAPGTCLPPQRALARMLGVGLGTLREAIKVLTVMTGRRMSACSGDESVMLSVRMQRPPGG